MRFLATLVFLPVFGHVQVPRLPGTACRCVAGALWQTQVNWCVFILSSLQFLLNDVNKKVEVSDVGEEFF